VLLAAGASTRLGTAKQLLLDEHGEPLVRRGARLLREAGCAPVVVVTGSQATVVAAALAGEPVVLVFNERHADGMGTSIACAVRALAASPEYDRVGGVLIAACDMPSIDAAHLAQLVATSRVGGARVASQYVSPFVSPYVSPNEPDGAPMMRGIPAVLPRADWPWLSELTGDRGAKPLLAESATLTIPLFRGMFDLDTPADVSAWRAFQPPSLSPRPSLLMSSIARSALADLEHEMSNTRRMLERIPEGHLDFKPHAKSWPLAKLADHLTEFPWWGEVTLTQSMLDFAAPMPPRPAPPTTAAGFVQQFDDRLVRFREALAVATDEAMMETWTLKNGEVVIMAMPRVSVLRSTVISHMIHHRAQLSIYFRMLDVPLPGLYGPSADEQ